MFLEFLLIKRKCYRCKETHYTNDMKTILLSNGDCGEYEEIEYAWICKKDCTA